ncbi:MAG TPA: peptide-methionine (S)-S-oxide reductase MsrA [Vicinamibacterales bacterium]|nr:peptide-methionine (S)-S-oxide reductase MsrA [Vicinamibacterales bacterium]
MSFPKTRILAAICLAAAACGPMMAAGAAVPPPQVDEPLAAKPGQAVAVVAGGCFWGVQAVFQHTRGVLRATSGYAGGTAETARYNIVSSETTDHAESVQIMYDPSQVTFGQLLRVFFSVAHDPTQRDRQGPDTGRSYRSVIFTTNPDQARIARAYIDQLDAAKVFRSSIATELSPGMAFYPAEDYHQDYATLHPDDMYIRVNDAPKLVALKQLLPELYTSTKAPY